MKGLLTIFLLTLCMGVQAGRKVTLKTRIREGYAALKDAKGQEAAEKNLKDSLNSTRISDNALKAEGWYICAMLEQSLNDDLNQKAYLKQKLDTAKLFGTVYNIYTYVLKCDTLDSDGKYHSKGAQMLKRNRMNLVAGGKYLLRQKKWDDAWNYFDLFLKTRHNDADSLVAKVAYWSTVAGVNSGNSARVLQYADLAIEKGRGINKMNLAEYQARAYKSLGDSITWRKCLEKGVKDYPGHDYFFLNLIDYYIRHGRILGAEAVTDSLLRIYSEKPVYWLAKSLIALDRQHYEDCILMCDSCLSLDSNNADAYYNKGISYLNLALKNKDKLQTKAQYTKAMISMEKLREIQPDAIQRWGRPLYRIYLNLNLGKKFDEVDKALRNIKN